MAFAVTLAQGMPRLERLSAAVIEEARKRRVLLPSPRVIDLLWQQARVRSERLLALLCSIKINTDAPDETFRLLRFNRSSGCLTFCG